MKLWGLVLAAAASLGAQTTQLPSELRGVALEQHLNAQLPLDAGFRDETGRTVRLGSYFGARPVLLTLVYYECPMLCSLELNALVRTLRMFRMHPGREFEIVTISFNPREGPGLAAAKKASYLASLGRPESAAGWHFLTGDEPSIRAVADAVGFRYVYDPKSGQYAHAAGIQVLTPAGKLARYFYGIEYSPRDLRLSLVEASAGKVGTPVDQLLLFCYHYDPSQAKYGLVIWNIIRAFSVLTLVALTAFVWRMSRRAHAVQ